MLLILEIYCSSKRFCNRVNFLIATNIINSGVFLCLFYMMAYKQFVFAALPYMKNPSTDPRFQVYFTKEWLDTLILSLRNFLCEVFEGIHILSCCNTEVQEWVT